MISEHLLQKQIQTCWKKKFEQIYDTVRLVGAESDFATLHKVYKWMVDGIQFTPQSGLPIQVTLIDFETPENNIFM